MRSINMFPGVLSKDPSAAPMGLTAINWSCRWQLRLVFELYGDKPGCLKTVSNTPHTQFI